MYLNRYFVLFVVVLFCFSLEGQSAVQPFQLSPSIVMADATLPVEQHESYLAQRGEAVARLAAQLDGLVVTFGGVGQRLDAIAWPMVGAETAVLPTEAPAEETIAPIIWLRPAAVPRQTPSVSLPPTRQRKAVQSYVVQQGDSFYAIAQRFNVSVDAISFYNNVSLRNGLRVGMPLDIPPEGDIPPALTEPREGEMFIWPVNSRSIIQYARWGHMALDIPLATGTPILAAAAGKVEYSGWHSGGYGYLVVIDHQNGWRSVYAHNSSLNVVVGQMVAQGEMVAESGNTGRSTMPHLHLEFSFNKVTKDPCDVLPLGC